MSYGNVLGGCIREHEIVIVRDDYATLNCASFNNMLIYYCWRTCHAFLCVEYTSGDPSNNEREFTQFYVVRQDNGEFKSFNFSELPFLDTGNLVKGYIKVLEKCTKRENTEKQDNEKV